MVIGISVCSCSSSSLERFGHREEIYFKEVVIKDDITYESKKPFLAIVRNSELSCFENKVSNPEEVITVRADDLKAALDYFYNSKASWDIKRVQKANSNITRMIATSETQIKYEVAYCYFRQDKFLGQTTYYASFRLVH